MSTLSPPSLLSGGQPDYRVTSSGTGIRSLTDLMYDGFYALFLLKNGNEPLDSQQFMDKMTQFLAEVRIGAKQLGLTVDDIEAANYAFCAAVDEIILRSNFSIREKWERCPLQLALFGDQLAGEHFFLRLERLRARGSVHLPALEVFYLCLLLGFKGRYLVDEAEKLHYLTARLGAEIAQMKGKSAGFAPNAERPDQISHKLRHDLPLWVLCSVFALMGALGYSGLRSMLGHHTESMLQGYNEVVKLAPRTANLSITLP